MRSTLFTSDRTIKSFSHSQKLCFLTAGTWRAVFNFTNIVLISFFATLLLPKTYKHKIITENLEKNIVDEIDTYWSVLYKIQLGNVFETSIKYSLLNLM